MLPDSLRNAHKSPAITILPHRQLAYNTPVTPLANEGERVGLSGQDTIYKMKQDNMLKIKPNRNTTAIPNAADGKVFMVPPEKKP